MIGRNSIVKKILLKSMQILLPEIPYSYREIVKYRKYFTHLWRQWRCLLPIQSLSNFDDQINAKEDGF